MDSSRSGLLSTLLMTLPLIVVPAVALLRPPGQAGISTVDLEASEDDEFASMFNDFDGFESDPSASFKKKPSQTPAPPDDQLSNANGDIFSELNSPQNEPQKSLTPGSSATPDPFIHSGTGSHEPTTNLQETDTTGSRETDEKTPDAKQIVQQLNSMGALKTMWFEAGDRSPVGLAVFFRGQTELTRIRFEAVGQNRDDCARHVLDQVNRWHQQKPLQ